ncbi:MAG TPA: lysophospholipid acyltransferase family protein [Gemmatimonadaceae bacterium]|nr:lysophospholipid acyltransferase family protein [Gemmatimonadaceae bacterium]
MLYALLRSVAGVALRWFYRRIDVEGLERLPRNAPLLLVVNHPNALVDALLVGWAMPRRVVLTAKAPLFDNRLLARFLGWVGVVPLVRSSDVRAAGGTSIDPRRNTRAFGALRDVLRRGGAVVIFPEGITHDNPSLAPLRTGAARIALESRDEGAVRNLHIVPIGLTFERKDAPRTRVLVQVGDAIAVDRWTMTGDAAVQALTDEIDARLRTVTQNYESVDDASRAAALSALFAALFRDEPESIGSSRSLRVEVSIARRIEESRRALVRSSDDQLRARADALLGALEAFEERLSLHHVALEDVSVSAEGRYAAPFVLRESWALGVAGPLALWGAINHWLPFHGARTIARRSIDSASDPAMRTIVAGAVLVLVFYALQGALVGVFAGWIAATLYVVSLPLAADVNFVLRERLERAVRRARTYLLFRRRPRLRAQLQAELDRLRAEALEIEQLLSRISVSEAV